LKDVGEELELSVPELKIWWEPCFLVFRMIMSSGILGFGGMAWTFEEGVRLVYPTFVANSPGEITF
jgi:hypothetical protein